LLAPVTNASLVEQLSGASKIRGSWPAFPANFVDRGRPVSRAFHCCRIRLAFSVLREP